MPKVNFGLKCEYILIGLTWLTFMDVELRFRDVLASFHLAQLCPYMYINLLIINLNY